MSGDMSQLATMKLEVGVESSKLTLPYAKFTFIGEGLVLRVSRKNANDSLKLDTQYPCSRP